MHTPRRSENEAALFLTIYQTICVALKVTWILTSSDENEYQVSRVNT